MTNPARKLAIRLIDGYQKSGGGSRLLVECNFEPSCSEYMKLGIARHGLVDGLKLGLRRLRRCNQPDQVGKLVDPVPEEYPD